MKLLTYISHFGLDFDDIDVEVESLAVSDDWTVEKLKVLALKRQEILTTEDCVNLLEGRRCDAPFELVEIEVV